MSQNTLVSWTLACFIGVAGILVASQAQAKPSNSKQNNSEKVKVENDGDEQERDEQTVGKHEGDEQKGDQPQSDDQEKDKTKTDVNKGHEPHQMINEPPKAKGGPVVSEPPPELPMDNAHAKKPSGRAASRNTKNYVPDNTRFSLGFGVAPGPNLIYSGQIDPSPALAARINFSERLILEPVAEYSVYKVKSAKASYRLGVQLLVKYAFIVKTRTRFYALAGTGFGYQNSSINNKTVDLSLQGGLGGEFFISKNWSISLDVISPLLVYKWVKGDPSTWTLRSSLQTTMVRPSLHLYF